MGPMKWGNQNLMQIYAKFEGFPFKSAAIWVGETMTPDVTPLFFVFNLCVFMFEKNMSCDFCLVAFCCHVFNGSSPGLYLCIMGLGT